MYSCGWMAERERAMVSNKLTQLQSYSTIKPTSINEGIQFLLCNFKVQKAPKQKVFFSIIYLVTEHDVYCPKATAFSISPTYCDWPCILIRNIALE